MAGFTYMCGACKHKFDVNVVWSDYDNKTTFPCHECGNEMTTRVYKPVRIIYKGSGFTGAAKENRPYGYGKRAPSKVP